MIIDFHTHIFPPRITRDRSQYVAHDPHFAALYSSPKARLATADELIDSMDEEGIDISVVLNYAWTTQEMCVETNDYILESITRYPGRLIGFCNVQLWSVDAVVTEIERCVGGGIRGVGEMRPDLQLPDLNNDEGVVSSFTEVIARHNLILLTHASEPVGHEYPGKGTATPGMLYPLITRYPDLTFVCAHWGGGLPFYALMPEVKKALRNVYFDTAASPFLYTPQIYRQVSQIIGTEKILFGSDYPLMLPSRLLKEIKSLELPEEAEQLILSGNARRLLSME